MNRRALTRFLLTTGLLCGSAVLAADCPPNPWVTTKLDPRIYSLPEWPAVYVDRHGLMTAYEWPVCVPDSSGYDFTTCPPEVEALAEQLRAEDPNLACRLEIAARTAEGQDDFSAEDLAKERKRLGLNIDPAAYPETRAESLRRFNCGLLLTFKKDRASEVCTAAEIYWGRGRWYRLTHREPKASAPIEDASATTYEMGKWSFSPQPSEEQLEAAGLHGKWVWELRRNTFRAAWSGLPYAWAITDSPERPKTRPADVLWSDGIGSWRVGVESYWNERLIRERDSHRSNRIALYMRGKWGWLGNQSTGNP